MIKGIDHIDIAVQDVEASVALFEKLGFKVLRRQSHHGGSAELALPGPNQFILDLHPAIEDHLGGKLGLTHIAFKVDDPQAVHDSLASQGVVFSEGWDKPHYVKSTGRTLINLRECEAVECLGEWYPQFVGPIRKEPAPDHH